MNQPKPTPYAWLKLHGYGKTGKQNINYVPAHKARPYCVRTKKNGEKLITKYFATIEEAIEYRDSLSVRNLKDRRAYDAEGKQIPCVYKPADSPYYCVRRHDIPQKRGFQTVEAAIEYRDAWLVWLEQEKVKSHHPICDCGYEAVKHANLWLCSVGVCRFSGKII